MPDFFRRTLEPSDPRAGDQAEAIMAKLGETELQTGRRKFAGSETFYRLSIFAPWLIATDGVKFLCDHASAYWLFDTIASHQATCRKDPKNMLQGMQIWILKVDPNDHSAVLICERDEGDMAITQEIPYADFTLPEGKIKVNANLANG